MRGLFKRWVAIEQLGARVCPVQHIAPGYLQNVRNQIWYTHSYTRRNSYISVTCRSVATKIKTFNWQELSLIAWLFLSWLLDLQGFKGHRYGIPKWARFCHGNKKKLCLCMYNVYECVQTMLNRSIANLKEWHGVYLCRDNALTIQQSWYFPHLPPSLPACLCSFLISQTLHCKRKTKSPHVLYFEGKKFILFSSSSSPTHDFQWRAHVTTGELWNYS